MKSAIALHYLPHCYCEGHCSTPATLHAQWKQKVAVLESAAHGRRECETQIMPFSCCADCAQMVESHGARIHSGEHQHSNRTSGRTVSQASTRHLRVTMAAVAARRFLGKPRIQDVAFFCCDIVRCGGCALRYCTLPSFSLTATARALQGSHS